jgi:hypothetical protein
MANPKPTPRCPSATTLFPRKNISKICDSRPGGAAFGSRDLDRAPGRRIADRILEQVHQDSLDQFARRPKQRQVARNSDHNRTTLQFLSHLTQRYADQLFYNLPIALQYDATHLQPRHVEQIVDLVRQAVRLVDDCFDDLAPRRRVLLCPAVEQTQRGNGDCRQRRSQVVRHRASQLRLCLVVM